ncbi:MAG: minor capsid protein [Acetobacterium sp.]|uniref:minor capsid protein n=1 Tax=Acetobacterium sp. TaxID=1872094 RepID=UPI003241D15C
MSKMTRVKINIDSSDRILLKRRLNKGGDIQKFFTHEVRRLSDKYVPMRQGPLKNTAIEKSDEIQYIQPYARRHWFENKGKGLRGKQWCLRMWSDRGPEIVRSVAKKAGVKVK